MQLASEYRVPHSIFLGRPWPAAGEPLFLPDDTDTAMAFAELQDATCSLCGTRHDEWGVWIVDPEGRRVLRRHRRPPYVATTRSCPGMEAIAAEDKLVPGEAHARGVRVILIPNPKG